MPLVSLEVVGDKCAMATVLTVGKEAPGKPRRGLEVYQRTQAGMLTTAGTMDLSLESKVVQHP